MLKRLAFLFLLLLTAGLACGAPTKKKHPETTDPGEARKDPDFATQGEYLGRGDLQGRPAELGAQVIALSAGKFKAVLLAGGLPGAGWQREQTRLELTGARNGQDVVLAGKKLRATIAAEEFRLASADGQTRAVLRRVQRVSPTLGMNPPPGAMVLLQGRCLENFPENHGLSPDGNLVAGATSKPLPDNYRLHLEFRLSYMPTASGQARSNSGVYLHDCYEIQVLDSFALEGASNECGGFYKIRQPDVNMCLPPLAWQTYDIDFRGPVFDAQGNKRASARISVRHNGVVIHQDAELPKDTPGRKKEGPGPRPIHLQGHGCHVQYRNLWVVPKP